MSGALIGFAGAIGALGGVFTNVVLRASYVSLTCGTMLTGRSGVR